MIEWMNERNGWSITYLTGADNHTIKQLNNTTPYFLLFDAVRCCARLQVGNGSYNMNHIPPQRDHMNNMNMHHMRVNLIQSFSIVINLQEEIFVPNFGKF